MLSLKNKTYQTQILIPLAPKYYGSCYYYRLEDARPKMHHWSLENGSHGTEALIRN
jgi:hypothetical protein